MKYVYVSAAVPAEVLGGFLGAGEKAPGQQAQKYNKLLATGLAENGREVLMLSAPPVPSNFKRFRQIRLCDSTEGLLKYSFLKVLNIPLLKNLFTYIQAKKRVIKAASDGSGALAVCDLLSLSASLGALKGAKKAGLRTCGIITDLPQFLAGRPSTSFYLKQYKKALELCDCYVLITEQVFEKLGAGGKPFAVIEGISSPEVPEASKAPVKGEKSGLRTVFYAGGLQKKYGIETMVNAFIEAGIENCRLFVCGSGEYAEELRELAEKRSDIVFPGILPNSEVMEIEKDSDLLINPRTSAGEYTAYSFPSKNIEYLSTGVPVLAYMLPGIPEEYRKYMVVPEDDSAEALAKAIKEVFSDPDKYRELGRSAKNFVLAEKSPAAQAKKLISILEKGS